MTATRARRPKSPDVVRHAARPDPDDPETCTCNAPVANLRYHPPITWAHQLTNPDTTSDLRRTALATVSDKAVEVETRQAQLEELLLVISRDLYYFSVDDLTGLGLRLTPATRRLAKAAQGHLIATGQLQRAPRSAVNHYRLTHPHPGQPTVLTAPLEGRRP